jgi:hypothetical protein
VTDPDPDRAVFLLQSRLRERGARTTKERWQTEGAFLTLAEAEAFARAHERWYFHGWQVLAVPAGGRLAELLGGGREPEVAPRTCVGL